ncbi:MAG: histidinol-phosphate transaminase [Vicinamibacterales bacterium]
MRFSRRAFVTQVGLGSVGVFAGSFVAGRGREALEAAAGSQAGPPLGEPGIRLDSNENPNGPGAAALAALQAALGEAPRYPHQPADALTDAIAKADGIRPQNIVLGSGSGEVLRMAVLAFTSPTRPLVQGAPTFEHCERDAAVLGVRVVSVPVDQALRLDLGAMARASSGAGLVFLCNPNNPTGTVHTATAVSDFISQVLKSSPETTVLVDEAYHHYVGHPGYKTAMPIALENPRVVVCRTFSKIYGMAGLRIGYGVGRPETISTLKRFKLANSVNVLGAAAAIAGLEQKDHVEREAQINARNRELLVSELSKMGFKSAPSEANFVMVDIRRDAKEFQAACRAKGVLVGRPFPPLLSQTRISIGTEDEMRKAVSVFRSLLT